jgi:hypothetical protein
MVETKVFQSASIMSDDIGSPAEDEAEDEADDIGSSNVDVVERGEGSSKTSDDLLDKERLMKKDCRVGRCDGFT